MTIEEALAKVDAIKPNSYTVDEKVAWLSEIDGNIANDIEEWYEKAKGQDEDDAVIIRGVNDEWFTWYDFPLERPCLPYIAEEDIPSDDDTSDDDTDNEEVTRMPAPCLLAPFPYDAMYVTWLSAKIDYANGDIAKYNNAKVMFDEQYGSFMNWVNRRLLHKKTRIDYL